MDSQEEEDMVEEMADVRSQFGPVGGRRRGPCPCPKWGARVSPNSCFGARRRARC